MRGMKRVLYTAFDVVPSPKGASTHIMHFIRGLVNCGYAVHLLTPNDGRLPDEDDFEGATITRLASDPAANYLERALAFGAAVLAHVAAAPHYDVAHYRSLGAGSAWRSQGALRLSHVVRGQRPAERRALAPLSACATAAARKIREQELAALALATRSCARRTSRAPTWPAWACARAHHGHPQRRQPAGVRPTRCPRTTATCRCCCIGTLADWQGLDLLVEALPEVLAARPASASPGRVRLRIVGLGRRQRKLLAKQIRKLGLAEHVSVEPPVPHHLVPALIAEGTCASRRSRSTTATSPRAAAR
jgi:hypothetical protein